MHLTNYSVNKQLRTYHFKHAVRTYSPSLFPLHSSLFQEPSFRSKFGWARRGGAQKVMWPRTECFLSSLWLRTRKMQLLMTVDNPKPQNGMRLNAAKLLLNTAYHALMRLIDAEFQRTRGENVILQSAKVSKWTSVPDSVQNRRTAQDMAHPFVIASRSRSRIHFAREGLDFGVLDSEKLPHRISALHMGSFSKQQAWGNVGRNEGAGASLASCYNNSPENEGCDCVQDLVIKTLIAVEEPLQAALDFLSKFEV